MILCCPAFLANYYFSGSKQDAIESVRPVLFARRFHAAYRSVPLTPSSGQLKNPRDQSVPEGNIRTPALSPCAICSAAVRRPNANWPSRNERS